MDETEKAETFNTSFYAPANTSTHSYIHTHMHIRKEKKGLVSKIGEN